MPCGKSFTNMKHSRDMKFVLSVLAVGLSGVLATTAADSSGTSAPVASGGQIQMAYPETPYKLDRPETGNSGKWKVTRMFSRITRAFKSIGRATAEEVRSDLILRWGTESSRAWSTIAGSQPNETLYGDCSVHEPSFGVGIH